MATLLVMKEELIVPRKKKTPVWGSNDCECTWYVRQRNTAQCYDHFPACTCDWSSLMELSDKGALLCCAELPTILTASLTMADSRADVQAAHICSGLIFLLAHAPFPCPIHTHGHPDRQRTALPRSSSTQL